MGKKNTAEVYKANMNERFFYGLKRNVPVGRYNRGSQTSK